MVILSKDFSWGEKGVTAVSVKDEESENGR
jgi:hypothetical protein